MSGDDRDEEVNPTTEKENFLPEQGKGWDEALLDIKAASFNDAAKRKNQLWLFKFPLDVYPFVYRSGPASQQQQLILFLLVLCCSLIPKSLQRSN
jgi:hypothetical protein